VQNIDRGHPWTLGYTSYVDFWIDDQQHQLQRFLVRAIISQKKNTHARTHTNNITQKLSSLTFVLVEDAAPEQQDLQKLFFANSEPKKIYELFCTKKKTNR
jgi:hypothetical protein